jgi:hypothetical protein
MARWCAQTDENPPGGQPWAGFVRRRNVQNSDSILKESRPRKMPRDERAAREAANAYRTALFDFGEGRISWATLRERCHTLRAVLRRRRRVGQ